jgi:DNA/RNA endonuclease YhcR with UshA esterase domain
MKNMRRVSLVLIVFFLFGSTIAFAHHGTANFDTTKSVTVKGTVTGFQFINPHVTISMDVKDDKGNVQNWQGALTSPNHLMRTGWTKDTLKAGDVIAISGLPAKTGAPEIWIQKVVLASGEALDTSGGN